jgi:hypothetical protein
VITEEHLGTYLSLRDAGASDGEAQFVLALAGQLDAIELSARTAYKTELRGKGGRWTRGGAPSMPAATAKLTRRKQQAGARAVTVPAKAAAIDPAIEQRLAQHKADVLAKAAEMDKSLVSTHAVKERATAHGEVTDMMSKVRQANADLEAAAKKAEHKKALQKAAVEGGALVAGGLIAAIEQKLGLPDLVLLASGMGPTMVQIITEWAKKL